MKIYFKGNLIGFSSKEMEITIPKPLNNNKNNHLYLLHQTILYAVLGILAIVTIFLFAN